MFSLTRTAFFLALSLAAVLFIGAVPLRLGQLAREAAQALIPP